MVDRDVVPKSNGDCEECRRLGEVVGLIDRVEEK